MPASRSASRTAKPAPPARSYWPMVLIGLVAVLAVIVVELPASIITRFLPPSVSAEDFSGSFWHGSAGRINVNARPAGALEWRLHPTSLLGLGVAADLHWVKIGFVVDAAVRADTHGITAHDVKGGGPIEDLHDLGVAPGWQGSASIDLRELQTDFTKPLAAAGEIQVSNLTAAQFAEGADLGGFALRFPQQASGPDGNVAAQLIDTGGPLELQAAVHYSPAQRTVILSGALRERPNAPAALHRQIENLAQMHARDPQGWVPVDLEFTL